MNPPREKIRLGGLLTEHKLVTPEQLATAVAEQQIHGGKLGEILIAQGVIDEQTLLTFLAKALDLPFIELRHYPLKPELVRHLPEIYARRFRAILLEEIPGYYLIGMVDPQDIFAFDELSRILKRPLQLALVRESELLRSIDIIYRRTEEISNLAEELSEEMLSDAEGFDLAQLGEQLGMSDAPVVKLLQSIFEDALQIQASDIHIEPDEHVLRIRQRVDGVLQEHVMNETRIASALAQRLKLMAKLNIAERRLPQDGRFSIRVKDRIIDVRLSTMPVQYGESIVMRLLDRNITAVPMDELGIPEDLQAALRRIIALPNGMLLVTGPTGSGKTTTLYSLLSELNDSETKIITAEDPVEYHLARISQVQINPYVELDFARILRSALRQDPDILMVGEIRDKETSDIAMRAAMTGHLVLATMHTNDAISSALRLLDMEGEGYLLAASLRAVLAQRLLRRVCDSCAEPATLTPQEKSWVHVVMGDKYTTKKFMHGKGCQRCNQTGYKGRIGVYELLEINEPMAEALRRSDVPAFTEAAQKLQPPHALAKMALELAVAGVTSVSETLRVTMQAEDFSKVNQEHDD
jgi:MSHA biogenesis protein MshE